MKIPDFFMTSTEHYDLEPVRRCVSLARFAHEKRDDLMWIKISPPLNIEEQGINDLKFVLIATRHEGASLFPIREWPVYVHVARVRDPEFKGGRNVRYEELEVIGWASIHKTEKNAVKNTAYLKE